MNRDNGSEFAQTLFGSATGKQLSTTGETRGFKLHEETQSLHTVYFPVMASQEFFQILLPPGGRENDAQGLQYSMSRVLCLPQSAVPSWKELQQLREAPFTRQTTKEIKAFTNVSSL